MLILAFHVFAPVRSRIVLVFAQLAVMIGLVLTVLAPGYWQEVYNIREGFHWQSGIAAAQPGYWVALGLSFLFYVIFQYDFWKKRR